MYLIEFLYKLAALVFATLFIIAAQLSSAKLAHARPQARVINGQSATDGAWPWMVSLHLASDSPSRSHFCGGMLIDSRYVLTAAHCVVDYVEVPSDIAVSQGNVRLTAQPNISAEVEGIIVHPLYSGDLSLENDLALVRLKQPIDAPLLPLISNESNSLEQAGTTAVVLGWGSLDADFAVRPDVLQQAEIPIVEEEQCEQRLGLDFRRETMMCAGKLATSPLGGDGVDSCFGDSGGPLIAWDGKEWRLVGIVSWGLYCGSHRYWGVYSRVSTFRDWILSLPGLAPRAISEPHISGTPMIGEKLHCTPGEWSGDSPLIFNFSWIDSRDGAARAVEKNVQSSVYRVRASDVGRKIQCKVTATNTAGSAEAFSTKAGPIFPKGLKANLEGKGEKLFKISAVSCSAQQCKLLLSFKNSNYTIEDSLVIGGNPSTSAKWRKAEQISQNSWLITFPKSHREVYNLFLRVYGPTESVGLKMRLNTR